MRAPQAAGSGSRRSQPTLPPTGSPSSGHALDAIIGQPAHGRRPVLIAPLLVSAHARLDDQDPKGFTALMMAANKDWRGMARLLLEAGAHMDAKENSGGTALFQAADRGYTEMACLLVEHGADVNATMH